MADLYIDGDGTIAEVATSLSGQVDADCLRIDAAGQWVLPGLVDLHVHFREPGHEYKETVASGCASAARALFWAYGSIHS